MIRKTILSVILFFVAISLFSYDIEQVSVTFIDTSRNNREIPTQIFIPTGNESRFDTGQREDMFPFIVFGHGWLSSYSTYQSVWEALVPLGWIIAFPTTEGGLFPNHQNFAQDLAFLSYAIPVENENPNSPLFEQVKPLSIVMGHSMGGGCSIMAASYENNFVAMVTLAAASTTAALNAASETLLPSLTFSGTSDWITPPETNQIPLYNNLSSIYKAYISFNEVNHSGIYNNDSVFALIDKWLNYFASDDSSFITEMEYMLNSLENNAILTFLLEYTLQTPQELHIEIEGESLIISWQRVLFTDLFIVEVSDSVDGEFIDISTGQGEFTEYENRVSWTTNLDDNESLLLFRVRSIR